MRRSIAIAAALASFSLASISSAGLTSIDHRSGGFASVGDQTDSFGDFGNNSNDNPVSLAQDGASASASATFTTVNDDVFRFSSSTAVQNTPSLEATAQVLNGANITIDSLTRMSLQFIADDASITTSAGLAQIFGYFRFSADEFGNPDFSGQLDVPATDQSVTDAPLLFSTFDGSPFDTTSQSATVDLPAGGYEFVFEFGYLGQLGDGAASIDMLDFILSFEELEAPDDGGDDDLPDMDDDDSNGGVGGEPGGGDPAVVPLPATAWGGLGIGLTGLVWRRLRK